MYLEFFILCYNCCGIVISFVRHPFTPFVQNTGPAGVPSCLFPEVGDTVDLAAWSWSIIGLCGIAWGVAYTWISFATKTGARPVRAPVSCFVALESSFASALIFHFISVFLLWQVVSHLVLVILIVLWARYLPLFRCLSDGAFLSSSAGLRSR